MPLERTWIEQAEHIRSAVTVSPKGHFSSPVAKESAIRVGYDRWLTGFVSADMISGFLGIGIPFGIDPAKPGDQVPDAGRGRGFDTIVPQAWAAGPGAKIGPESRNVGEAADRPLNRPAMETWTSCEGLPGKLPVDDGCFDLVISSGV